jgi:protein AaeX
MDLGPALDAALDAVAGGDVTTATARLEGLDHALSARPGAVALRARGSILAMTEVLTQHVAYSRRRARVRFTEINLFGVYVAPISVMMVAAWVVTVGLRRFAARFGLLRYVWHPSLFVFAVYMIVLSAIVVLFP